MFKKHTVQKTARYFSNLDFVKTAIKPLDQEKAITYYFIHYFIFRYAFGFRVCIYTGLLQGFCMNGLFWKVLSQPALTILISFLSVALLSGRFSLLFTKRKFFLNLAFVLAAPLILYYMIICLLYANTPSFLDHIEPTIAMESMLINEGKTIYTTVDNENRISLLYGPSSYLVNALFLKYFNVNPIFASKLAGVSLALGSLLVLFISFAKRFSFIFSYFSVVLCILLYLPFGHFSFWNRPDSVIIFACSLSCGSLFVKRNSVSAILFALSVALAVNSKFHSVLYLVPLAPLYIYGRGFKLVFLSSILSVVLVFIPFFVFASFSLPQYLQWLLQAGNHDLSMHTLMRNLSYSFLFLLPVLLSIYFCRTQIGNLRVLLSDNIIQGTFLLFFNIILVAIIASKEGSGPNHLAPFAPIAAVFLCMSSERLLHVDNIKDKIWSRKSKFVFCLGLAWFFACILASVQPTTKILRHTSHDSGGTIATELNNILLKYPDSSIAMGYADHTGYHFTYFRPLLFERTSDYFMDAPAMMDMAESDLEIPPATIEKIRSQEYDIFLIPKGGEPFTMKSLYLSKRSIFGDILPVEFKNNYVEVDTSDHFSIWSANKRLNGRPKS